MSTERLVMALAELTDAVGEEKMGGGATRLLDMVKALSEDELSAMVAFWQKAKEICYPPKGPKQSDFDPARTTQRIPGLVDAYEEGGQVRFQVRLQGK